MSSLPWGRRSAIRDFLVCTKEMWWMPTSVGMTVRELSVAWTRFFGKLVLEFNCHPMLSASSISMSK
jgi:hypothetical protein